MSRWMPEATALWLAAGDQVWPAGMASAASADAPALDFAHWCAAHPGQACRLWLGAAWLQPFTAPPEVARAGEAALRAWGAHTLAQYHGAAAATWPLLPWRGADAAVAGVQAVPAPALARWQAAARQHGVRLLGVHPGWSGLWPALRQNAAAAAAAAAGPALWRLDEGPQATVLQLQLGRLQQLLVQRGQDAARDSLLCANLGLPAGTPVHSWPVAARWRQAPPGGAPAGDFLRPQPVPRLPWALAAAALLVLAVAGVDAAQAWQARAQAQQRLAEGQARAAACASTAPAQPAGFSGEATAAEAGLRAALAHPWPAVMAAAEAATVPGVQWLGLDQGGPQLRLEGLASDLGVALRSAAALSAQPGWRPAELTRVQPEGQKVRFELRALRADGRGAPAP